MKKDAKEKVAWDLERRRLWNIDSLRTQLERAKKIIDESLQKLDQRGLDGYYSMNHDIVNSAFRIWKHSYEMGLLKSMEKDILEALENNTSSVPTRVGADATSPKIDPFEIPAHLLTPPEEADGTSSKPNSSNEEANEE